MTERNHVIDLLRFFASAWVAVFHFNETVPYINNWYRHFFKLGYLGVPIFFVISGYCVYMASNQAKNAMHFIIRRIFRVFPPYWFSIIIVGIVVVGSIVTNGANSIAVLPKSGKDILATITLLTTPFSSVPIINWVYWTLTFELFFYFLIFIGLLIPYRYRVFWFISISISSLLFPIHEHWPFFFIGHWPSFCFGIVTYRLLHCKDQLWLNILLLTINAFALMNIIFLPYYSQTCIVTCLLIIISHYIPLKQNFASKLGDYSYSIYLLHVPIAVYMLGSIKQIKYVQTHIWANLIWDFVLLGFISILSRWMYFNIELPSIILGKKLTNEIRKNTL